MEIKFMPRAEEDLAYWKAIGDKRIMKRITKLLADILEHPFTGIGKPEPLNENCMVFGAAASPMSTAWFIPLATAFFMSMCFLCDSIILNSF